MAPLRPFHHQLSIWCRLNGQFLGVFFLPPIRGVAEEGATSSAKERERCDLSLAFVRSFTHHHQISRYFSSFFGLCLHHLFYRVISNTSVTFLAISRCKNHSQIPQSSLPFGQILPANTATQLSSCLFSVTKCPKNSHFFLTFS